MVRKHHDSQRCLGAQPALATGDGPRSWLAKAWPCTRLLGSDTMAARPPQPVSRVDTASRVCLLTSTDSDPGNVGTLVRLCCSVIVSTGAGAGAGAEFGECAGPGRADRRAGATMTCGFPPGNPSLATGSGSDQRPQGGGLSDERLPREQERLRASPAA